MNLFTKLGRLFGRRRFEDELDEEMRFHLEQSIERNIERGMSPVEARREAMKEFGGVEQAKEESRDAWGLVLLIDLWRDLRYAAKSLVRVPGFTTVAVLTLGLGVGVNAVMFSFVRDTVLRPMVRDQQLNLVALYNSRAGADRDYRKWSYREFETLQATEGLFAQVAATVFDEQAVGLKDDLQRRFIAFTSANYFELLDIAPHQGRFFTAEEARPDALLPVAVANYAFWQRLGADPNFVGSTIRVNQRDYTIIGIAPESFVGVNVSIGPDVWLPLGEHASFNRTSIQDPGNHRLNLIARLLPGLPLEAAQSRLESFNAQFNERGLPEDNGPRQIVLTPPSRNSVGNPAPSDEGYLNIFALLSTGLATTVLIVACLNLANMILARGASRQKEIAIRLSLGASRGRIIRQLTTEGLLLSLVGGAVGLYLSFWAGELLLITAQETFASSKFVLSIFPYFDAYMIGATFLFCLLATVVSSLGPALRITRPNLVDDLKQSASGPVGSSRWRRFFSLGNNLVILQIALSLTLLFAASMFVRSSNKAATIDLGYQTEGQVVANLDYGLSELNAEEIPLQQNKLLEHFTAQAGSGKVALATNIPYNFELPYTPLFRIDGARDATEDDPWGQAYWAGTTAVSEHYFDSLQITLLRGRAFTFAESTQSDGPGVAIISENLANHIFGETDPIGQRIFQGEAAAARGDLASSIEIVGIVRSPREEVFLHEPPHRIYRPLGQARSHDIFLHVATPDPVREVDTLRRQLQDFDPATPPLLVRPLASFVEENINSLVVHLTGIIFGVFGVIALFLAVVGVYGVKSHAVSKRTREIGIRMALGARPQQVMKLILSQAIAQTLIGITLGVILSVGASKVLASMIYQAGAGDSLAIIGSALILALAVLFACWLPARRATKVDPATTLRSE
ncbi:MAG: ABC transporter permease [Synoicihabitans sp.]